MKNITSLIARFKRDEAGVYVILLALLMPLFVGAVGLATDYGLWVYQHQSTQSATDSAAVSAATEGKLLTVKAQAQGVAASYGFVDGANGAVVTVHMPPTSGSQIGNTTAVEVIITKPAVQTFSSLLFTGPVNVTARSVAMKKPGFGCVIALNATVANAIDLRGSGSIQAPNCDVYSNSAATSAITTCCGTTLQANVVNAVGGISGGGITATAINPGAAAADDPYATVDIPSFAGCGYNYSQYTNAQTIYPGVYCNGFKLQGNAVVTMSPGIYYLDGGAFTLTSSTTLRGTGVTIVLTSSTGTNWPTVNFAAGSTLDLTAPTNGNFAGIAIYQNRSTPVGTVFAMTGGSNQNLQGSIYAPSAALSFAGGSSTTIGCNQIVADTIKFTGNGSLSVDCTALGTKSIGGPKVRLAE